MSFSCQSRRVTDKAHHGLLVNRNDHAWAGRSLCMGGAASERCDGGSGKAGMPGRLQLCDIWKMQRAQFLNSRFDCRIVLFVRLLAEMSDKIK